MSARFESQMKTVNFINASGRRYINRLEGEVECLVGGVAWLAGPSLTIRRQIKSPRNVPYCFLNREKHISSKKCTNSTV